MSSAQQSPEGKAFLPLAIAILTVSDSRKPETDKSGDKVAELASHAGHQIAARQIIADDAETLRAQMRDWIADPAIDVIIATGGTGVTGRDVTPEALAPLISKPIPGFGELFRMLSLRSAPAPSNPVPKPPSVMAPSSFSSLVPPAAFASAWRPSSSRNWTSGTPPAI